MTPRIGVAGTAFLAALVVGCGGAQRTTETPQSNTPSAARYRVTVVSATIADRRPDGTPWHVQQPSGLGPALGALVAWSFGIPPSIGVGVGGALAGPTTFPPPNPRVRIQVGPSLLDTPPVFRTLTPRWDYAFALDVHNLAPDTPVTLQVIDGVDSALIGSITMSLGAFLHSNSVNAIGEQSIQNLQIAVEPLPAAPEHRHYHFRIPRTETLVQLASDIPRRPRFDGDWQGIRVLNGDAVHVSGTGNIRPSCGFFGNANFVAGPEGFPGRWADYSIPDFHDLPHAALIGMIAGRPYFIGRESTVRVERPGIFILGINDNDAGNNCGDGFTVDVDVDSPGPS